MNNENLQLSNTSYTNKDFFDVYPELLEMAKKLSYKWDPTVSNESDPGVVLLKELAIAIDKINYTSDKNALETMPLSITQAQNARVLYNLLGYYPKWYKSAKTNIVCGWSGDKSSNTHIIIPAFTQIADADSNYIYTTIEDIDMKMDGSLTNVLYSALEGTCNTLTVNGVENITLQMLDSNNRIYLNESNVAYNGIFVKSSDHSDYWEQVDNINFSNLKDSSENHIYAFNIDQKTNQCYLEFPDNIDELIGDGLSIKYILSSGKEGNIAVQTLSKFCSSTLTVKKYTVAENSSTEKTSDTVDTSNIGITNVSNEYMGEDPQTMDEMYNNWKYIAGTFDTLVTIRDYNNALKLLTDYCSNGYCCDRTNDIQDSYKVFVGTDNASHYDHIVETDAAEKPLMNAFDLKLYCTHRYVSDTINKYKFYNQTFQLYEDTDVEQYSSKDGYYKIIEKLSDYKCISHNYSNLEPDKMCMLKNMYTVNIKITPNYKLNTTEQKDLINTICRNLYSNFRCENMEFGKAVDTDDLYKVIENSDSRIRYLYLEKPEYTTYAIYFDSTGTWHEIPVANLPSGNRRYPYADNYDYLSTEEVAAQNKFRLEIQSKNILAGVTPYIVANTTNSNYEKYLTYNYYINSNVKLDKTNCKTLLTAVDFDLIIGSSNITSSEPNDNSFLNQIEVSANEVIQFYKPNLMDYLSYGTYINYAYNGITVHQNSPYELQEGEFLISFYKEADTDAKYKVEMWGPGTIILPTFELLPSTNIANQLRARCFSGKSIPKNGNVISTYYQFDSVEDYPCLAASLEIQIKKVNEKYLGGERLDYIYFITNDSYKEDENDDDSTTYYKLTLSSNSPRILSENEYFVYTNSTKTALEIFGAGTRLQYCPLDDSESFTWEVKQVPLTDIMQYGLSSIEDYVQILTTPQQIHVTEQAFNNAIEGDTLNTCFDTDVVDNTNELDVTLNSKGYIYNHIRTSVVCSSAEDTPEGITWKTSSGETITGTLKASPLNAYKVYEINDYNSGVENIQNYYYVPIETRLLQDYSSDDIYTWNSNQQNIYLYKFNSLNKIHNYIFNNNIDYAITSLINNRLQQNSELVEFYHYDFNLNVTTKESKEVLPIHIYMNNTYSALPLNQTVNGIWEAKAKNNHLAYFIQNGYLDGSTYHTLYDGMKICVKRDTEEQENVVYGIYKNDSNQLYIKPGIESTALNFKDLYDYYTTTLTNVQLDDENILVDLNFPEVLYKTYKEILTRDVKELNRCLQYDVSNLAGYINFYISGTENPQYSEDEAQFCLNGSQITTARSINISNLNITINDETIKSSISSSIAYSAETFLNIAVSSTEPQKIKSNHTITIDGLTIHGDTNSYLYCSDDLLIEGSNTQVNIALEDVDGKTYYPSFLIYSLLDSEKISNRPLAEFDKQNMQIYLDRFTTPAAGSPYLEKIFANIKLTSDTNAEGNYIFKLQNINTNLSELKLRLKPVTATGEGIYLKCFNLFDEDGTTLKTNIAKQGTYFLEFSLSTTLALDNYELYVEFKKADESKVVDKLVIYPMRKYKIFNQSNIDNTELKKTVIQYDKNKSFNYLYVVSSDKVIINPLSAESFNDENHIYNKFTICEAFPPVIKV